MGPVARRRRPRARRRPRQSSRCACSASGAGGPRRSVAGSSAGAAAALLALGLDRLGLGRRRPRDATFAIGIPATMAAAVTLDLLARPARWRSASAPGSSSHPGPFGRSAGGSRCSAATASWCACSAARASVRYSPIAGGATIADDPVGVRLRRVLEEAGGVYIKLGQIAATRVDLLPPEVCDELAGCRTGRARAGGELIAVLEAELGGAVDTSSPSSTGSRSPRRRSVRPTARGCGRARRSS